MIYKLRAIVLAVRSDDLVSANEEFMAWLREERFMPSQTFDKAYGCQSESPAAPT